MSNIIFFFTFSTENVSNLNNRNPDVKNVIITMTCN